MYRFIPRLPTALAWEQRRFSDHTTLESIVKELKDATPIRFYLRGELVLKKDGVPSPKYPATTFSGPRELEDMLKGMKWDGSQIHQIRLFQWGYFIINEAPFTYE